MVNQLVAGSFDLEAEVFVLREVRLPFPPVFSHLTTSVLTNGAWMDTGSVPTLFTVTRRD